MEMMMLDNVFRGDRLKALRNKRDLLQQDVADELGMTKATLSRFETGARQPDANMLVRLANYFNCSVDYLLGRIDDPDVTLEEYINKRSKEEDIIGLHFSNDELKNLSKEKIDSIIDFVNYQIESEKKKR